MVNEHEDPKDEGNGLVDHNNEEFEADEEDESWMIDWTSGDE